MVRASTSATAWAISRVPFSKELISKNAHRTVPDDGLGFRDLSGELLDGLVTNVDALPSFLHSAPFGIGRGHFRLRRHP